MRLIKPAIIILLYCSIKTSAQFSIETFLNEPIDQSITSIKEKLSDKKFEVNLDGTFDMITYYDWLEPVSININLMFKKNGNQVSKSISNAKESEDEAKKLFDILNAALIQKYGNSVSQKSLFGVTVYSWYGTGGSAITFAQRSNKTILMIMTFK